jgi:hypothetical protein
MRWLSTIAIAVALLAWSSLSCANIIDLYGAGDGDYALSCVVTPSWTGTSGALDMVGDIYVELGEAAHMVGTIDTDTPEDPTITYGNAIDNETAFAWTKFYVNYTLDSRTSITGGLLALGVPAVDYPADWSGAITQQLAYVGNVTIGAYSYKEYKGTITYTAGTPVVPGDELDFTYKLQGLSGGTHYIYTQEMVPIPEPGTLALVLSGLLGLAVLRRRWA